MHYIKTLSRKPGALIGSVAFEQMNTYLKEVYHKYFKNEPKSFIELLELIGNSDITSIKKTISILTQKSIAVNIENIKMITNRKNEPINIETHKSNMQKEIEENAKYLKLAYSFHNGKELLDEHSTLNSTIIDFYNDLLQREADIRYENGKEQRVRNANFPYKKYLTNLEREYLPEDAQNKLNFLETLEFIKNGQNVILAGNPGTGKTHIAIGLGIQACREGFRVLFTSAPTLINKLKECKSNRTLTTIQRQFESYDLIILDELGYISFDKECGELLFTHLSLRAERKSTIITTNLSFEKWEDIFKDPVMTAAIIDRITHKAIAINMNGNSYRLKETEKWISENIK